MLEGLVEARSILKSCGSVSEAMVKLNHRIQAELQKIHVTFDRNSGKWFAWRGTFVSGLTSIHGIGATSEEAVLDLQDKEIKNVG